MACGVVMKEVGIAATTMWQLWWSGVRWLHTNSKYRVIWSATGGVLWHTDDAPSLLLYWSHTKASYDALCNTIATTFTHHYHHTSPPPLPPSLSPSSSPSYSLTIPDYICNSSNAAHCCCYFMICIQVRFIMICLKLYDLQ